MVLVQARGFTNLGQEFHIPKQKVAGLRMLSVDD